MGKRERSPRGAKREPFADSCQGVHVNPLSNPNIQGQAPKNPMLADDPTRLIQLLKVTFLCLPGSKRTYRAVRMFQIIKYLIQPLDTPRRQSSLQLRRTGHAGHSG